MSIRNIFLFSAFLVLSFAGMFLASCEAPIDKSEEYAKLLDGTWKLDSLSYTAAVKLPGTNPPVVIPQSGKGSDVDGYVIFSEPNRKAYYKLKFQPEPLKFPTGPPINVAMVEVTDTGTWTNTEKNIVVTNKNKEVVTFQSITSTDSKQVWDAQFVYKNVEQFGDVPVTARIVATRK